ncbi:hypothetical protein [Okeania sp. SIO3B5]|uniref:hypothetical protein n=1 Tax=Okeania sp. SIO3B5 TaxID=2607811 RepID=UPI0025CD4A10|nr:hypothetical protein [Okeania sp. SIO3B5]
MDRQSPKVSPGWLQPEKLIEFIDELRREHNYNIGVSQYIAAQELILALSAKGEQLEEPQRLRSLLGPLLCSSPAEQEDFQRRFDQWIERMGFAVGKAIQEDENAEVVEHTQEDKNTEAVEHIQEDKNAEAFEQELKKIERKWRWQRWVLLAIAVSVAIVLTYSLIQQLFPRNTITPTPTPTNTVTPTPTPRNTITPTPTPRNTITPTPTPRNTITPTPTPTNIVTPTPTPTPRNTITPTPTPKDNDTVFLQEWRTILLLLMLVPIVIFLAWRLWWYWRASLYLKRRATRRQPEIQRVSISGFDEELFPSVLFLHIAQGLRRRIRVLSNELDVDKTVEKTLRRGGWFAPVYGYHKILPEYLVLIDRANYGDHQARFVKEMIAQLTHNEVLITSYYFDSDPRVCFPMTGKEPPSKLREIALKYSQHRLIVFSNADGFFSSLTGEPEPWLDLFSSWPERAVLTPKPSEHWGYQELELSREFIVLPARNDGLIDLIRSIEYGKSPYVPSEKSRASFPEVLRVRGRRWIERDPPEPWLVADVLESLRRYLGKAGYYWLSACAVFPELHWNLTVYLGNMLQTDDGSSLLQACRLTDLARLPWFRYGYMPDWLRSWLIYELPRQQEDEIRQLLRVFLVAKPDDQGIIGRRQLEIARQHSNLVSWLAQPLLRLLSREAPMDSPLRDYIFQEFMAGSEGLAVRMPDELREQLRRKYSQQVGWWFWFEWVLLNTAVSPLGLLMSWVVIMNMRNATSDGVLNTLSYGAVGAAIELAQWLVFRKRLSQASWWILATFLGSAVGLTVTMVLWVPIRNAMYALSNAVVVAVIGTVTGVFIGLPQWLVIRTQLFQTGWWILANVLSSVMGLTMLSVASTVNNVVIVVVSFTVIEAIYGVINASALVLLLRQPGNSAINNQN